MQPVRFGKGRAHLPRLSPKYVPGAPRHERFWTAAEIEVVRRHYETRGAKFCASQLPGRSLSGVYSRAHLLGLKCAPHGAERKHHPNDPQTDRRIRQAFATSGTERGALKKMAADLGLEYWWLKRCLIRLGLTRPQKKEPNWTRDEEALLRRTSLRDLDMAVRIFREHGYRRTRTSLIIKAKRLELSRKDPRFFSAASAGALLGIDGKTVTSWVLAGEIKATRRKTRRLPQQGGDPWEITRAELRRFIVERIELLDIRRVDKFAFVDLLARNLPAPAAKLRRAA